MVGPPGDILSLPVVDSPLAFGPGSTGKSSGEKGSGEGREFAAKLCVLNARGVLALRDGRVFLPFLLLSSPRRAGAASTTWCRSRRRASAGPC